MEVSHADLSEITGMILVEIGSVVVLTTGHTATTGMLAVLSNATVTGRNMTAALSCLRKSGRHLVGAGFDKTEG